MEKVEWEDVQGLVLSGYPKLPFSAYLLWRFRPHQIGASKRWLKSLADRLMCADAKQDHRDISAATPERPISIKALKHANPQRSRAVNLALTSRGFRKLEVGPRILENFSLEFLEGMAPRPDKNVDIPRRTNVLGDLGDSLPASWDWGGWNTNGDIDGVLLLFAPDEPSLQSLLDEEIKAMSEAAEPIRLDALSGQDPLVLKGRLFPDLKEHFGYTDGISQPIIEGSPKARRDEHSEDRRIHFVKPGEFVLGYDNERRARAAATEDIQDLRRNGTYLVFRQLEQDVAAFNDFVTKAAAHVRLNIDPAKNRELIAAKLVGRYPSGEPLIPTDIDSEKKARRNDFLYYFEDRFGLECPVGAHIRRANPRDSKGPDPETALRLSKMHRIVRRSRMYGERFNPSTDDDVKDTGRRGVLFICLNADIAGQFELIQHTWLNNRHFGDQYVGVDPIGHFAGDGGAIPIQRRPINLVLERPKPFVRVRGGAYFFMPGIAALRALSMQR